MKSGVYISLMKDPKGFQLSFCLFILAIIMAAIYPVLPIVLSQSIGLDKAEITTFLILTLLVGIVVTFISGYLSDRKIARYKIILVSGITAAMGFVFLVLAQNVVLAYLAGTLTTFITILFPQFFALSKNGEFFDVPEEQQIAVTTYLRVLFSLGYTIGPVIIGLLVTVVSYELSFIIMSGLIIGITVFGTILAKRSRPAPSDDAEEADEDGSTSSKTNGVVILMVIVTIVLMRSGDATRDVYMPLITYELFKNPLISTTMFSISAAAELLFMFVMAHVAMKIGERITIFIGALVGSFYFLMMSLTESLMIFYALQVVYAIFISTLLGVAMAYVQNLIKNLAGFAASIYMNATQVGALVGYIAPLFVSGYDPKIFLISGALCLCGALVIILPNLRLKVHSASEIRRKM